MQLRARRDELLGTAQEIAGELRGALASRGKTDATDRSLAPHLRAVSRELAYTDDAVELVSDLLRPGTDRQADRAPVPGPCNWPASGCTKCGWHWIRFNLKTR